MNRRKIRSFFLIFLCTLLLCPIVACGDKDNEAFTYRAGSTQKENTEQHTDDQEELYMVEELNMEQETINLLSLNSGRQLRYSYSLATRFQNKYGDSTSSLNFVPGIVVTIGEPLESKALSYIKMSDKVWQNDSVKNFSLDTEQGMLTIGTTRYRMTEDTEFFSDSNLITAYDISEDDVLRVVGRDKDIISVSVITGHGYIQLINTDLFEDSMICVGNRIFTTIHGAMRLEVMEGTYNITVANGGYGGTGTYTIKRNETVTVDLNELKGEGPKFCQLSFQVSVAGATIYLDGNLVNANDNLSVAYGSHKLSIVAEGYDTWNKTLVVNSPSAVIVLDLSDETDSDTGSTTTTTDKDDDDEDDEDDKEDEDDGNHSDAEVDYLTTLSDMISSMLTSS